MRIRRFKAVVSLSILSLLLAACGASRVAATSPSTTGRALPPTTTTTIPVPSYSALETPPTSQFALSEVGSDTLFPLFGYLASAYSQQYPNIRVSTASAGSGAGIVEVSAGTANIGASGAYLSSTNLSATPSLINIPIAIGSQMIDFNLPGIKKLRLTGKILARIYEGKITSWNDPAISAANPGITLPALRIIPLRRADGSGDTFNFTQFLSISDPTDWGSSSGPGSGTVIPWPTVTGELSELGNSGMISTCQATRGCVAYIGSTSQSLALSIGLGQALLQNASGNFVSPTVSAIKAEASAMTSKVPTNEILSLIYDQATYGYPITNYEYVVVNSQQTSLEKVQAIRSFISWCEDPRHGGSALFLSKVKLLPIPSSVTKLSLVQLTQLAVG